MKPAEPAPNERRSQTSSAWNLKVSVQWLKVSSLPKLFTLPVGMWVGYFNRNGISALELFTMDPHCVGIVATRTDDCGAEKSRAFDQPRHHATWQTGTGDWDQAAKKGESCCSSGAVYET